MRRSTQIAIDYDELETRDFLEHVVDEFVLPLANMAVNKSNTCNLVDLCFKAMKWMESPVADIQYRTKKHKEETP